MWPVNINHETRAFLRVAHTCAIAIRHWAARTVPVPYGACRVPHGPVSKLAPPSWGPRDVTACERPEHANGVPGTPAVLGTRRGVSGRQGRRALGTRPVSWARLATPCAGDTATCAGETVCEGRRARRVLVGISKSVDSPLANRNVTL